MFEIAHQATVSTDPRKCRSTLQRFGKTMKRLASGFFIILVLQLPVAATVYAIFAPGYLASAKIFVITANRRRAFLSNPFAPSRSCILGGKTLALRRSPRVSTRI